MIHYAKELCRKALKGIWHAPTQAFLMQVAHSQVRLAGMAGVSYIKDGSLKFAGALNAGYEFKGVSILYDQRHQVFSGGGWFGGNAGYTFSGELLSLRPYAGYWYKNDRK